MEEEEVGEIKGRSLKVENFWRSLRFFFPPLRRAAAATSAADRYSEAAAAAAAAVAGSAEEDGMPLPPAALPGNAPTRPTPATPTAALCRAQPSAAARRAAT